MEAEIAARVIQTSFGRPRHHGGTQIFQVELSQYWMPEVRAGSLNPALGGRGGIAAPGLFKLECKSVWRSRVRECSHKPDLGGRSGTAEPALFKDMCRQASMEAEIARGGLGSLGGGVGTWISCWYGGRKFEEGHRYR